MLKTLREVVSSRTAATVHALERYRLIGSPKVAALAAVRGAVSQLSSDLVAALEAGRADARHTAFIRVQAELSQLKHSLKRAGVGFDSLPLGSTNGLINTEDDNIVSYSAATSYVAAWLSATMAAVLKWSREQSGSVATAISIAAERQDYRLGRLASTETSQAYNDEHAAEWADFVDTAKTDPRNLIWLGLLFRRWDAILDRKTCPICARLDGEVAIVGQGFSSGYEPGSVHPHCRCIDTTYLASTVGTRIASEAA